MEYPEDLLPLPTAPYNERPESLPLDTEECRTALWLAHGNISDAADTLKITSSRLRAFVRASSYLTREMEEANERIKDKAVSVVIDALNGPPERSDTMARFVLGGLGKDRGFGAGSNGKTKVSIGDFTVEWNDTPQQSNVQVIDHE